MRWFFTILVLVVLAVAGLGGWLALDAYRLAGAVRDDDVPAFAARVDMPAVRRSLAAQFIGQASAGKIKGIDFSMDPAGQAIVANLIAVQLESILTPEAVVAMLRSGQPAPGSGAGTATDGGEGGRPALALPRNPLSALRGFGISLPATVRLTVGEGDDPADWITLAFTLGAGPMWRVTDVVLPDRVFRRLGREVRLSIRSGS